MFNDENYLEPCLTLAASVVMVDTFVYLRKNICIQRNNCWHFLWQLPPCNGHQIKQFFELFIYFHSQLDVLSFIYSSIVIFSAAVHPLNGPQALLAICFLLFSPSLSFSCLVTSHIQVIVCCCLRVSYLSFSSFPAVSL